MGCGALAWQLAVCGSDLVGDQVQHSQPVAVCAGSSDGGGLQRIGRREVGARTRYCPGVIYLRLSELQSFAAYLGIEQ